MPSRPDSPSAHARFPWAPAILCAASLAMAAWTWMRYSYCWDTALRDLPSVPEDVDLPLSKRNDFARLLRALEQVSRRAWPEDHWLRERYVRVSGRVACVYHMGDTIRDAGSVRQPRYWTVNVSDGAGNVEVLLPPSREAQQREGDVVAFRGRLVLNEWWWMGLPNPAPLSLDTSAGRLHPASAAGLVVAAMGAFVFALYLRSWLRERRGALPADVAGGS